MTIRHTEAEPVLKRFMAEVGIKGTMTELVPGRIWKLGRRGQQGFIFINRVMIPDLKTFGPVLGRFPGAIFVTVSEDHLERLNIVLPNRGIVLKEVTRLDENYTIHFDTEKIEAIITPEEKPKTKSSTRRGNRSVNIEKLIAELKEHYRRAKDHYFNSNGEILRRPTQAELARLLQIRQNDVSRCLNDPDAVLLQTLWKNAEDIRFILNS